MLFLMPCNPATRKRNVRAIVEQRGSRQDAASVVDRIEIVACGYAVSANFTRQTVDAPLPVIFAAFRIDWPPFNRRTMSLCL